MFSSFRTGLRSTSRQFPHVRPASTTSTSSAGPSFASSSTNTIINKARAKPFLFVLGLMPLVTFGLGSWQIKRLNWKLKMIDQLEEKLNQNMVRLPARIEPAAIPEFAYRKVFVEGTFDYSHEIMLGPRTRDGELGFHVITPLVRGEGKDTILVNRGFVKRVKRTQSERPDSLTEGKVELVGMLRDQDQANSFTPPNNAEKGEWVFANIDEMAKHAGTEPVLVDEIFSGHAGQISMRLAAGVPVGRSATIELRNQHMTYAITWPLSLARSSPDFSPSLLSSSITAIIASYPHSQSHSSTSSTVVLFLSTIEIETQSIHRCQSIIPSQAPQIRYHRVPSLPHPFRATVLSNLAKRKGKRGITHRKKKWAATRSSTTTTDRARAVDRGGAEVVEAGSEGISLPAYTEERETPPHLATHAPSTPHFTSKSPAPLNLQHHHLHAEASSEYVSGRVFSVPSSPNASYHSMENEEDHRGRSRAPRLLWMSELDLESWRVIQEVCWERWGKKLPRLRGTSERDGKRFSRELEKTGL